MKVKSIILTLLLATFSICGQMSFTRTESTTDMRDLGVSELFQKFE